MNKYKYLLKNTGILAICNFSSKILVFLLVPLYTSVLTTNEYGAYDLISTTIQLLMPLVTANIYEGTTRFLMDPNRVKKDVLHVGFVYITLGTAIFGIIVIINDALQVWDILAEYSLLAFIYFFFSLFYQYMIQTAKGLEKIKYMGIAGVIGTFTTVGFNILFLLIFKLGIIGFFLAYILGQAIPAFYLFIHMHMLCYLGFSINRELAKEMVHYSVPLVMNTLGWWVNSVSDRYVVTELRGISANGIYSVSYKIPAILSTFQAIFTQSWQISAVKEYEKKGYKTFFGNITYTINMIVSLGCMVLILFTRVFAKILYAKDFYQAWQYVPFLLISVVLNACSGMLGPILSAKMNSKAMATSAIYGAITNIVLNVILVYAIGIQGAAIATAISSLVIYICRRHAVGDDMNIHHRAKYVISWVIITLQAIVMIYTNYYWLQILLIAMYILISRKEIIGVIAKGKNIIK